MYILEFSYAAHLTHSQKLPKIEKNLQRLQWIIKQLRDIYTKFENNLYIQ